MSENHSIKEYYIKLERMMTNAVNMLTALNKSLVSTSSEITVDLVDLNEENEAKTSLRIPSFLYVENKIEQLDNIISNLFNIPKSGEAWFDHNSEMYKLSLVKSNNAPLKPEISDYENIGFNIKDNNIFKDLVSPKTYIRLNISNLPDNINKILMKKLVIFNKSDAEYLSSFSTYSEIKEALFNRNLGTDYEEYDTVLDLPIKADKFISSFKIEKVERPEVDTEEELDNLTEYIVNLDTLTYYDKDDESIQYSLHKGDFICLSNDYAIYKIKDIRTIYNSDNSEMNEYIVRIEESVGRVNLQTFEENSEMYFQVYNDSYDEYHYIDIPLEENPNIILFLSTLYNNVRSTYSDAIHLDLNNIYMKDENNNLILDDSGNKIGYIEYYTKFCKNIGDLMVGLTKLIYPQVTNFSNNDLLRLTDSDEMKQIVTESLYSNGDLLLSVVRINSHLIDDETSKGILELHSQKNDINSQLRSLNDNIDQVYTQLTTTDFSQEATLTQESLRSKLNDYYAERTNLEKQLLNIVDDINLSKSSIYGIDDSKYRVRGTTDSNDKNDSSIESPIISFLHNEFGFNCDIIGLDVEYKYKTATKDSTKVVNNNSEVIFTDWNRLDNIERERYLKFDPMTNKYVIAFSNYSSLLNVIKWNQIDIPINQGEDVIIRIRYKYNIGQPFINLYTPWSNEITVEFPVEYTETTNISSILDINDNDTINAKFIRTLINDGYEEHITNKIVDNSAIYYHMPENIYSGFNTPENNLISLKDKLIDMNNEINSYKIAIDNEINSKYAMILEWDNTSIELSNMTNNNITINELINGSLDSFVKKKMNLVIKNIGSTPIKLYSIFPGNVETPLINFQNKYFDELIVNYDRVPMLLEGSSIPSESIIPQYMGQWIYFRQNNPYTLKSIYYDNSSQNNRDTSSILQGNKPNFVGQLSAYIGVNNQQALLPYRNRYSTVKSNETWGFLSLEGDESLLYTSNDNNSSINYNSIDNLYLYDNCDNSNNEYLLKYEHLLNTAKLSNNEISYLSENISFSEFVSYLSKSNVTYYNGAFLIPELISTTQILCDTNETNQYKLLDVGKTLSIPILFEYFLTPNETTTNASVSKTLAFDIKTSLMREPDHYILTVTAKYDYSQSIASTESYTNLIDGLKIS